MIFATLYHVGIGMGEFTFLVAMTWFGKMLLSGVCMFLTLSPFAYLAVKSKGLFVPMIVAAGVVMFSAALSNQDLGALYPWTATYLLVKGALVETGYPVSMSISIIAIVSISGVVLTLRHFKKEDIK